VTDGEHRQMGEERAGAVHGGLFSYLLDRAWPGPLTLNKKGGTSSVGFLPWFVSSCVQNSFGVSCPIGARVVRDRV
jgi:hypothetical protein